MKKLEIARERFPAIRRQPTINSWDLTFSNVFKRFVKQRHSIQFFISAIYFPLDNSLKKDSQ